MFHLSGQFLPDNIIHGSATVGQTVDYLIHKYNKPKKLAEELSLNTTLQQLPNLKIFPKRQNIMTKDEELGRGKVIQAELRERNLIE